MAELLASDAVVVEGEVSVPEGRALLSVEMTGVTDVAAACEEELPIPV